MIETTIELTRWFTEGIKTLDRKILKGRKFYVTYLLMILGYFRYYLYNMNRSRTPNCKNYG